MKTIKNRYQFDPRTDDLGKGGFGRVFHARDTLLNRDVVLKFAEKGNLPEKYSLIQEISRVIDFNHPNLVRYYDAIVLPSTNNFGEEIEYQIGIMEYVQGGNLRHYMDNAPQEEEIVEILKGTLRGLSYLHERNIIHRDIKPPNILLSREGDKIIPKICDFGISKFSGSEATTLSNVIGTFEYMSPEQLGSHPDQKISTNSDLWSVGIMTYELFTEELPFGSRRGGTTDAKIVGNILAAEIPQRIEEIPQPFRELIQTCLVRDPRERLQKAEDLLAILYKPEIRKPEIKIMGPKTDPPVPPVKPEKEQIKPPKPVAEGMGRGLFGEAGSPPKDDMEERFSDEFEVNVFEEIAEKKAAIPRSSEVVKPEEPTGPFREFFISRTPKNWKDHWFLALLIHLLLLGTGLHYVRPDKHRKWVYFVFALLPFIASEYTDPINWPAIAAIIIPGLIGSIDVIVNAVRRRKRDREAVSQD